MPNPKPLLIPRRLSSSSESSSSNKITTNANETVYSFSSDEEIKIPAFRSNLITDSMPGMVNFINSYSKKYRYKPLKL